MSDGRVMIAGGENIDTLYRLGSGTSRALLRTTAIFDPHTNSWSRSAELLHPRAGLTAIALADGRVAVLGGGNNDQTRLNADVELWSPQTQRWQRGGALLTPRWNAAITRLNDGRILVAGGADTTQTIIATVEIYDPQSGHSTRAAPLPIPLVEHVAVALNDGRVLVLGGASVDGQPSARAFTFDPHSDRWTEVGPMSGTRQRAAAIRLLDGRVLVVGNRGAHADNAYASLDNSDADHLPVPGDATEIFDPRTGRFAITASTRQPHLGEQSLALLADGSVAIFGPFDPHSNPARIVEVYVPSSNTIEDRGDMPLTMTGATSLRDGRVLLVGPRMAINGQGAWRAAQSFHVWDPRTAPHVQPARASIAPRAVLEDSAGVAALE